MKFAVIALLGLTQSINLAHKEKPDESAEKPVWREYQPDLYTDKDSVLESEPTSSFHDLENSDAF
jgi:hypothetical protein|tara:strand:- start:1009 stop:1203 length:195 start_codon:yes stop_codon:yes gene_type:complete